MPIEMVTLLLFGGLVVGLLLGIPVVLVLGGIGAAAIFALWGPEAIYAAVSSIWGRAHTLIFIAVPMFILMANVLRYSGIGDGLYEVMHRWFGGIRGGLASGTIIIGMIVGAMSGLSATATFMMGLIALPAMLKRGYSSRIAIGSISAGGSLGILIPPSVTMCIYGVITNTSIGHLFIGGVFPGVMLGVLFIIYITVRAFLQKNLAPAVPSEERANWSQKLVSLRGMVLPLFLILAVMGSIFFGVATVTEASVVGAAGSILCAVINRRFSLSMFRWAIRDTFTLSGMALWIVFGATCFNAAYIGLGAVDLIRSLLLGLEVSPLVVLLAMMAIVMLMGCFMDGTGIIMICMPIFIPIIRDLGFDPVWFGVLFVINLEMGLMTPPFGYNLFYMRSVVPKGITMIDIYLSMFPFIAIQVIGLLVVILIPQIVLWLPGMMMVR